MTLYNVGFGAAIESVIVVRRSLRVRTTRMRVRMQERERERECVCACVWVSVCKRV